MAVRRQLGVAGIAAALVAAAAAPWWLLDGPAGAGHDHGAAAGAGDGGGDAVAFYTCSMDPSVEAAQPGSCPICGMALTPVSQRDRASGVVRIDAAARARLGLRVVAAGPRPLRRRVAATGEVAAASPERADIAARLYRGAGIAIPIGSPATVSIAALPLIPVVCKVDVASEFLQLVCPNPDGALQANMLCEVQLDLDHAPGGVPPLAIPAEAVIHAGGRRVVFVEVGPARFEPRAIELGVQASGWVEVVRGLAPGDRVVAAGVFLLAAESRIRSAATLWDDRATAEAKAKEQAKRPRSDRADTEALQPEEPPGGPSDPAGTRRPSDGQPGAGHPPAGQPGTGQPAAGQPGTGHPPAGQPAAGQPGTGQPAAGQPAAAAGARKEGSS